MVARGIGEIFIMLLDMLILLPFFGIVSAGIPYLIVRRRKSLWWNVFAYAAGMLATSLSLVIVLLIFEAGDVRPEIANRAGFGNAVYPMLLGPAIGLWLARNRRSEQLQQGSRNSYSNETTNKQINIKRGALRAWIVSSVVWLLFCAWYLGSRCSLTPLNPFVGGEKVLWCPSGFNQRLIGPIEAFGLADYLSLLFIGFGIPMGALVTGMGAWWIWICFSRR
jgi:hypothetical protein